MKNLEEILRLYNSLQPSAWSILSFQIKRKEYGNPDAIRRLTETEVWLHTDDQINQIFGTKRNKVTPLLEAERGIFPVYVWTEGDLEEGRLHSFGMAHPDTAYRSNFHYFSIEANLDQLNEVVKTFLSEPKNMSKFVAAVFGWQNDPVKFEFPNNPYASYKPEPELFTWMNELHVYTPQIGYRRWVK